MNKSHAANRFAWELEFGPIPDGMNLCHDCPGGDNTLCVRPNHMFIGSQKDNMMDAARKSRTTFGEKNTQAKLNEKQVLEIRRRANSGETIRALAKIFGVSYGEISFIKLKKRWDWLP